MSYKFIEIAYLLALLMAFQAVYQLVRGRLNTAMLEGL